MTRKHFIALAAILSDYASVPTDASPDYIAGHMDARAEIAKEIARMCAGCNANFDRARFLAACGVSE